MSRLLVTGAAGFIGSNFVRYWVDTYPDDHIVIADVLTYAGSRENVENVLSPQCVFVKSDINDTETMIGLLRDHSIDTIVHFAAETHVDRSIEAPDVFIEANILGTHSLLKAARQVWLQEDQSTKPHRFHHVSTDEVFGSLQSHEPAFSETTPYAPNSPYSSSKASSDFLVRAYHHTYGLSVTTSHCSNNYGPYQFPEKLIPLIIINVLNGRTLPIYGDGKNIRDWLYVIDHARGVDKILKEGVPGETYNIGGENEWANIEIIGLICTKLDKKIKDNVSLVERYPRCPASVGKQSAELIRFVKDRSGHDFRYAIDTGKIQKTLNFSPDTPFEHGLDLTIDWFLENSDWWG